MVSTQGSSSSGLERQGTSDDEICRITIVEVVAVVSEAIPEIFASMKTVMIKMFDERYTDVTEAVTTAATVAVYVARPHGDSMQYREFNHTKPPKFDGV